MSAAHSRSRSPDVSTPDDAHWGDSVTVRWQGGARSATVEVCVCCKAERGPQQPVVVAGTTDLRNKGEVNIELPARPPLEVVSREQASPVPCWVVVRIGTLSTASGLFSVAARTCFNLHVQPVKIYRASQQAEVRWNTAGLPFIPAVSVKLYDSDSGIAVAKATGTNVGRALLQLPASAAVRARYSATVTSLKLSHIVKDHFHGATDAVVLTDETPPPSASTGWQAAYLKQSPDRAGHMQIGQGRKLIVQEGNDMAAVNRGAELKLPVKLRIHGPKHIAVSGAYQQAHRQLKHVKQQDLVRMIAAAQDCSENIHQGMGGGVVHRIGGFNPGSTAANAEKIPLQKEENSMENAARPASPTGVFDFDEASPRSCDSVPEELPSPSGQFPVHKSNLLGPDKGHEQYSGSIPWSPPQALLGPSCLPPIISAKHHQARRRMPSLTSRIQVAMDAGNVVDFTDYGVRYGEMVPNRIDHDKPVVILM